MTGSRLPAGGLIDRTKPISFTFEGRALTGYAGDSVASALLANEPSGALLESTVLAHLSTLRGLDTELDRLELALIYGAAGVLGTLSIRIGDLRARLSHPSRAAASWS